jgi:D-alanyl-D-alanine carboxypeptidase
MRVTGHDVPRPMRQVLERRSRAIAAALLLTLLALPAPPVAVAPASLVDAQRVAASTTTGVAPAASVPALPASFAPGEVAPLAWDRVLEVARARRLQSALDAARAGGEIQGVSAAVAHDGELVWSGTSGTDGAGRPLTVGTPMVIGSVTKTFMAAAVLQLAEEGRVDLEQPVSHYLPELAVGDDVTVRQLLDHTSGLADLFNDATRTAIEEHPEELWDTADVLEAVHGPLYEPGEGWAYANTNYLILGLLVERAAGSPLGDELGRRFFTPLDLDHTGLISATEPDQALAPAWASIFWASGAMVSTTAELARWGDALYGGRVLASDSLELMLAFNGDDHGLGVQRLELAGVSGYGHTGLLHRYTTLLLHLPDERLTIALIANRARVDLAELLSAATDGGGSLLGLAQQR